MSAPRNIPDAVRARQSSAADPTASVFVSANAGSGKTYVLVQRVINLLLKGVDPSTILCITYTKAAAANMSNRVFATLAEWSALDDAALDARIRAASNVEIDARLRARARRLFALALETPGGLKVQTIHAFCTRLLHQFPFEANVAARFTVMEESQTAQLLNDITMAVLLEAAAAPASAMGRALETAAAFAADQTVLEAIADAVAERDRLTAWIRRAGSLDAAIEELSAVLGAEPGDSLQKIESEYDSGPFIPVNDWQQLASVFATGTKTDKDMAEIVARALRETGPIRSALYRSIFLTGKDEPRKRLLTKTPAEAYPQWLERLNNEQQRILSLLARERAVTARERSRALFTIAGEVVRRYEREREHRGLLDYDDLIAKTLDLFSRTSASWVLYKLDAGIDHVLIDEAQDTSPSQWEIVGKIVSEFSPGGARPNVLRTLFAVGDEKQSIYSFQGADPSKFDEMRRHFRAQFTASGSIWRDERLDHSFRSGEVVLQAVDTVFAKPDIYTSITANETSKPVHVALPDAAPGMVEIWPLIRPGPKREIEAWDAPFDEVSEKSPDAQLADRITRTIAKWREQGTKAGDILILVRARNARFENIIRALKQSGIPVAGADRLVLTEHIAVMDLMALADALLLPEDDLALASALKSPLFGLTERQLFDLAWNRPGSLRAALQNYTGTESDIGAAAQSLNELQALSGTLSPFAFFSDVLGARGGRKRFLARLGPEANEALDEFLGFAFDFESRDAPSLQGFVQWLRTAHSEIKRDMELSRDQVRVMTVHGAKGLEAKNVILADTTAKPTGPKAPRLLSLPVAKGAPGATALVWAAAKGLDTEAMNAARTAASAAARDEYRRLLYVAMTRAAERLVVCGVCGEREPAEDCWHRLVSDAFGDGGVEEEADAGNDRVRRFYKVKPTPGIGPADTPALASSPAQEWLRRPAEGMRPPVRVVSPSRTSTGASETKNEAGSAFARQRGVLMHRLLQSLPDVPPERRADAAESFLARAAARFERSLRDDMTAQVFGLLRNPEFEFLFGPRSRPEVSVVGRLDRPGGGYFTVSGQADRVAVNDSEVFVIDYKTHRAPPASVDEALAQHPGYVRQLALYRGVLAQIYPGRAVRAGLIWTDIPDLMEIPAETLDRALAQVSFP